MYAGTRIDSNNCIHRHRYSSILSFINFGSGKVHDTDNKVKSKRVFPDTLSYSAKRIFNKAW